MFWEPGDLPQTLAHNPFKAIVSPRPIGWISTLDAQGTPNLAPYSFFNAISDDPPMVIFSQSGRKIGIDEDKDTVRNIRETKEFCVNIVSETLKDAMNISSGQQPAGVDEFQAAGLKKGKAKTIAVPFVQEAPAVLECSLWKEIILPGQDCVAMIGLVTGIHIDTAFLVNGIFDVRGYKPLARLGYRDYSVVRDLISLNRPGQT
jgi:flavin reductase (DIM6/NTAB) family NADH-FMN oxidoreductase RutF